MLYDTFSAFGVIISTPKVQSLSLILIIKFHLKQLMRNPDGTSKGFGFLSFDSFDASDAAIAAMNGQYLAGKPISVTYALKKDSKTERYGSAAERILSANNPNSARSRPNNLFAAVPPPPGMGRGGMPFPPMPMGMGMPMPPMGYGMPMQPPTGMPYPPPGAPYQ